MVQKVQGVISRAKDAPVELVTVLVPDPGPGEAVVKIQACGVCHTDLHYKVGGIGDDYPYLLGHEAAGIVEAVGEGVTDVAPGRLRHPQLACRVRRVPGLPAWSTLVLLQHPQRQAEDDPGGRHRTVARRSASAPSSRRRWSPPGQCTKVDPAAPATVAGLLGCGVMAGLGAAINTGAVTRGDSVAVIGCGGVGDAAIAGSRLAGAGKIIAVDMDQRKLDWAKEFGATHTILASDGDVVEADPGRSPAASAPTSSSTRSADRKPGSRPSTAAISPAPSCWSACPIRR